MSEAELIGLFLEASQNLDSNFEFWLTASFALIIASYFLTEKLPYSVFWLAMFLYVSSTLLFMVRGMTAGRTLTSILDQLKALNTETALISTNENLLVAFLYFVIMVVGTVSTIAFVYWRFRKLSE